MGVVYAAYDPDLDRKVALKLLRAHHGDSADLRARLLREAQAMARLTHPNVVSVYDVGSFEDRVFVAMEFVDGRTLSAWRKEAERSWREVLQIFQQAGSGLAAAHAAGLVHRDFKPSNVLVRRDGVVKVSDFGLALSQSTAPADCSDRSALSSTQSEPFTPSPSTALGAGPSTTLGASVGGPARGGGSPASGAQTLNSPRAGTPGYMAPEQLRGEPLDARADQYSFCVALYEALLGERPAEGQTLVPVQSELAFRSQPSADELPGPPKTSKVPAFVLQPILRGLGANPGDRFESLEALLTALAAEPKSKWKRAMGIGAVAGAVLLTAGGFRMAIQRQNQICKGSEAKLAGIWDGPRRAAIQRAFAATVKPYAADAFNGASRVLDAHAQSWVGMRTEACEATRLRGEQSEALLDLRMGCLQRRLDEVKALTDLFEKADRQIVEKSVEAAQSLTPLRGCADVASLTAPLKLPEDANRRTAIDQQRVALAEVQALRDTGKYSEGLARAKRVAEEARKIGYKPLEAEALLALGALQVRTGDAKSAEQTFQEAGWAAEASRHDEVKARAWIDLVQAVGYHQARFEQAHQLANQAVAAVERLENPPELMGRVEYVLGTLALKEGKHADAVTHLKRSLEIREKALGPDHREVGTTLSTLATVARERGHYDEALGYGRRSLQILEKAVGLEHPQVADAMTNIGNALKRQNKLEGALEMHQRALAIREKAIGPESPATAAALGNIANVLRAQGQLPESLAANRRALTIQEKTLGPESVDVARTVGSIANVLEDMGDIEGAIEYDGRALSLLEKALGPEHPDVALTLANLGSALYEADKLQAALQYDLRALAIREKVLGPDHPLVATVLDNLAGVYDDLKNPLKGLPYHQRALAIREKALGTDHPLVAMNLTSLARSYVLAGKPLAAIPYLERGIAMRGPARGDSLGLAITRFTLARALWDSGKDRRQALALGQQAYDAFLKSGQPRGKPFRELEAWLLPKLKGQGRSGSQGT